MGYPSYDKIVHTLSGVFTAFVVKRFSITSMMLKDVTDHTGKITEKKAGSSGQSTIKRKIYHSGFRLPLHHLCFVVFIAAMWECFWIYHDQLCGGHMQELNAPGVGDTMGDIISASIAGFLTAVFIERNKNICQKQPAAVSQVSSAETAILISLLQQVLAKNIEGDVVELGCYKGDTSILFQREYKEFDKSLWLYDSLCWLPEKAGR